MSLAHLARIWHQRIRSVFRQGALDAELARELAFHFDALVNERLAEGMSPQEARCAARRALGNVAVLEEQCRDERRVTWFHDLRQDLLYGLRMLQRTPGFTAVAVVSLALGIGANGATLAAIDRVLLGALPFPHAERLVVIRTVPPDNPRQRNNASLSDYVAWTDRSRAYEAIGASLADQRDFGAEGDAPAERIAGQLFTPGLFSVLGIRPLLGRVFSDAEAAIDNPARVIVISDRFWRRRFSADPNVLGRQVRLNGVTNSIVGVMPPEYGYPGPRADYWAPLALSRVQLQGSARFYLVVALLKTHVTVHQAETDLQAVAAQLGREFPDRNEGWGVRLQPIRDALFGWALSPLLTLQAAVMLILLIACANVAGLLLARGTVREPEIALRMALGAGRGRIIRQLLAEGVPLSLLGGALGIVVAWWGLRGFVVMSPPIGASGIGELGLNGRMLVAMAVLAVATTMLFSVAPALAGSKLDLSGSFQGLSGVRGARHQYLRGALVAGQISMALILLTGAGLLVNSFLRLAGRDLTFDPRGLLTFEYRIPGAEFMRPLGSYRGFPYFEINPPPSLMMERVYDRLRGLPGAESVAGVSLRPLNALLVPAMTVTIEGRPIVNEADRAARTAAYFLVTPNYFATLKAPFVSGRDIDGRDVQSAQWVAVVNETMARKFWPGDDPIGKRFTLDIVPEEEPREVVGVVRDIPLSHAQTDAKPVIYASYLQQPSRYRGPWANMLGQMTFVLRSAGPAMNLVPAARAAVAEIDPNRPLANIAPIMFDLELGLRRRRPFALVLGGFALAATVLAAIGVYGAMTYAVAQRTREIGIRRALGASRRDITAMVGRQACVLVATGVIVGLAGAFWLTRLIASQLWGVTPTDPVTFAGVSLLLVSAALVACVVPVRRAVRVDPTVALKYE